MADADRLLIKNILSGDLRIFRTLIENHERLVAHIVCRLISNPADQEEICQEIFIRVYQNLAHFKFEAKLSTWIARIAYHTTINHLRKEKVPLLNDSVPDQSLHEDRGRTDLFDDTTPAPDALLEAKDRRRLIEIQLKQLPPLFSTILTLFHLEQMSYQEIGTVMDLPEGTVKSYLFRARKKLKDVLEKELKGEEL